MRKIIGQADNGDWLLEPRKTEPTAQTPSGVVVITLGNGVELRIDNDHLFVTETTPTGMIKQIIDLGLATKIRIEQLQDYLGRLYVHGLEENVVPLKQTRCSVCLEPQFDSPSGMTCINGHGGAEAAE